ncbi:MAG: hypothetical protein II774_06210, partial [Lachnospiraceae bacterium]|nr:hypothetical protein [Lachnospiraceae bacterium]MBQ4304072.1 hypothetical protein [Lachnospiraceae bacterium]
MNRKSITVIAAAFLAGVLVTAIAAYAMYGPGGKGKKQEEETKADAGNIDYAAVFPSWNPDSASLHELVDFVAEAADESGPAYLEPADRIAVFDMDGTILCEKAPVYVDYCLTIYRVLEDPSYFATEEERYAMEQVRDHAYYLGETFSPEGITKDDLVSLAFAGMTPEEFRDYV